MPDRVLTRGGEPIAEGCTVEHAVPPSVIALTMFAPDQRRADMISKRVRFGQYIERRDATVETARALA